jgi:glycosyltransferase involved in cell wall biosynthesis
VAVIQDVTGLTIVKVLHVTQGYFPTIGGVEWLIQRVSEEIIRQFGDEVTVFTTNCYNGEGFFNSRVPRLPVGWQEINGVEVRRFSVFSRLSQLVRGPQEVAYRLRLPFNEQLRWIASGPIVPGLGKAIKNHRSDVIVAASFPLMHMFTALRSARETRRPCVLIGGLHPVDDWGFNRARIYKAIQLADHYVALTDYERQYVISRGAQPEKVTTIGLGVDPALFQEISNEAAKRRLGLENKPLVGFIGQLGGHKGIDTLVRAMPQIWIAAPDTHFLIAGARTLFAEKLEIMINDLPESDRKKVKLYYNFSEAEKPWLFGAVDVFAYPSGFESFGIAFLEAWIVEKPVIGCWDGAVPCVVQAGRDGLLVNYRDEAGLAEAVILLIKNPRWARSLGQAGKEKVLARYTWPEVARRFRQVYANARKEA